LFLCGTVETKILPFEFSPVETIQKEVQKMITKELIIQTATQLFVENGVKTVTVDKIVKQLRTSKRTVYNHFENKTELLRACLAVYHLKVKTENETIINAAPNAIAALGSMQHEIVKRTYQVNPNFFSDIIHYHPGLLEDSYRNTKNFAHQQILDIAQWGIEDGIFQEDMDIEVVGKTVLVLLKLLKDNSLFPISKYSKERLTFGTLVPYLRGLCTPKGVRLLSKQEELFKISI
jgi:AcrR family transcriptional regulator